MRVLFFVVKKEPVQEIKTEDKKETVVKVENPAEYQTIDKNCDIFSGDISSVDNKAKAKACSTGDLKIKIKIEAPSKGFVCKPKPKSKKEKKHSPKKNVHVHQYVCKTCGDKFTTLGTLQKHIMHHTKELQLRNGIDKECCVAMCEKSFVKGKCEPKHHKIIDGQHKAKMEEKAAAAAVAAAKAVAEAEAEAAAQAEEVTEGKEDMEVTDNTLAGYFSLVLSRITFLYLFGQ